MANLSNAQDNEENTNSSLPKINNSLFGLENTPSLSQQIKAARERMGLSQRVFAEKIGITQAQMCRLERNCDTKPTRKTLKALSPFLAKPYSELLVECGYNGVISPQEEYYSYSGDSINITNMIEEIFQADPDFLKCLSDFSQYGTPENISVLKILMQTMMITEKEEANENVQLLKRRFQCLKEYILGVLSIPIST